MGGAERVMLEEACRLADRLDHFDQMLRAEGKVWATIVDARGDNDMPSKLIVTGVLSEARQTAGQLRQHIVALDLVVKVADPDDPGAGGNGASVDPLAAAREARATRQAGAPGL